MGLFERFTEKGGHSELGSRYGSPQITVINHDDMVQKSYTSPSYSSYGPIVASGSLSSSQHLPSRLVRQGTNSFDSATIHIHTPECSNYIHQPVRNGSPVNGADGPAGECDFHCCALHEEGRRIAVHKSVATSPILDAHQQQTHHIQQQQQQQAQTQNQTPSPQPPSSLSDGTRRSGINKGHVRFRDTAPDDDAANNIDSASGKWNK